MKHPRDSPYLHKRHFNHDWMLLRSGGRRVRWRAHTVHFEKEHVLLQVDDGVMRL